jgi:methanogenic corrinoid protein MtbC1
LVAQEKMVRVVKESHPSGKVRAMVGGARVNHAFLTSIGADNCGRDARAAVPLARQLLRHA